MGLYQFEAANYNTLVGSGNIRYRRWPAAAASGVTCTSGAANTMGTSVTIVAAATITDPSWLCGVEATLVATKFDTVAIVVDIGTGVGAVAPMAGSFSNVSGLVCFGYWVVTAAGQVGWQTANLPFPIRIPAQPALCGAIAQQAAGGGAPLANIAVECAIAVGT
jgi:hypothetical protein